MPGAAADPAATARVARTMLSLYGGQSLAELRRRAMACLDAGDMEGFQGWQAILQAAKASLESPYKP